MRCLSKNAKVDRHKFILQKINSESEFYKIMAFKIKQEKTAPELESARAKLEEALQYIIEKTDETPSTSEDESNKLSEIVIKKEPSPVSSPAKRPAQRTQRKRRRKDEALNKNTNSYVMKLFDRAVDLTPFTEQTPLYPICRAWINNQSLFNNSQQPKEEPVNDENETGDEIERGSEDACCDEIRQLPPPVPLPPGKDLRIPSPVPPAEEPFIICSEESLIVSKELLMASHLQRWKAVRRKWKQAAKNNEERYKESTAILKSMFDRAQGQEENVAIEPWDSMTPAS